MTGSGTKLRTMEYVLAGIEEVLNSDHGLECKQCREILEQAAGALARWTQA